MSIRPIPNLMVYNHPVTPEIKRDEEIRRVPVPGIGVVFRAAAPLLEKVEEKVERRVVKIGETKAEVAEEKKGKKKEVVAEEVVTA